MSEAVWWWCRDRVEAGRPCLFMDRDGVVVEETNYLCRAANVKVLDGVSDLISAARTRGFIIGLVTNQAGVGRGYYDWADFEAVQDEVARQLDLGPQPFDFIAACGAHPDAAREGLRHQTHPWRKPAAGMLLRAAGMFDVDMSNSIMIGDQVTDLKAGDAADVGFLIHVRTGHGDASRAEAETWAPTRAVPPKRYFVDDLREARGVLGWT